MHKLAKKILVQATPKLEKMLDEEITEKELYCLEAMVNIAHDLIESDVMLHKMEEWDMEKSNIERYDNPKKPYNYEK